MNEILSHAMQDYLKTIYHLHEETRTTGGASGGVTTQAIATRLSVAAPSATAMIKKLASQGLARHTPYYGVELTSEGEKIALEMVRHHRLSEAFLTQILGLDWDKAHEEADKWEHILSEEVEAKMAALLGEPTHDPHGAPIPTVDGRIERDQGQSLARVESGKNVVVRRVSDEDAALLRHLLELGLVPGARVEVLRAVPAEGVLQLRVEQQSQVIGLIPASAVVVEESPTVARRKK